MTKALIIKTDGNVLVTEIDPNLEALQEIVGGPIEYVSVGTDGSHLYCDEEAKLAGGWLGRANKRATALVDHYNPGFAKRDILIGDVVVLGHAEDGEEGDVHEGIVAYLVDEVTKR